jgi:hypothetical protein
LARPRRADCLGDGRVGDALREPVDIIVGERAAGPGLQLVASELHPARAIAATHPDFPAAFIDRPHAKLWSAPRSSGFAENWDRKPGRPSSAA